jgi:cytochrome b561
MMPARQSHYGATAKALHWLTAGLLVVQLPLGWLMPGIPRGMNPDAAMSLHVSIGVSILLLMTVRLLWRLTHPVAPESELPAWQRIGAELIHWLLYSAVGLTTATGWLFSSARGWTIHLFGLAPLPRLVEQGSGFGRSLGGLHVTLTWILFALIGVHVLAALVHLMVYKDRIFHRMLPG